VPPNGGVRGDWAVVCSRRRKAFERIDGKRDRFQVVERRGRGWERQQRRRTRDTVQQGSELGYSDMENLEDFEAPVQSYDGRVVLQYSRPGRVREDAQHGQSDSAGVERRQHFWGGRNQQRAPPSLVRRRSRFRYDDQQQGGKRARDGELGHSIMVQHQQVRRDELVIDKPGKDKQPFVSFYFTNVPENISYISLRRGFEVCGIMEDVYLAKKRNANGAVFGFE